jgi:hypothetical protein
LVLGVVSGGVVLGLRRVAMVFRPRYYDGVTGLIGAAVLLAAVTLIAARELFSVSRTNGT